MKIVKPQQTSTPYPSGMGHSLGSREFLALSQLAALQGHCVSCLEFKRLAQELDEKRLSGVPLSGKIAALWLVCFPHGTVRAPNWPLNPTDLPALWMGNAIIKNDESLHVILASMENGGLNCLKENGRTELIAPEAARRGRILMMKTGLGLIIK